MTLHTLLPPDTARGISPAQAAQLTELLQYLHLRLRGWWIRCGMAGKGEKVVLRTASVAEPARSPRPLACYLRQAGEPENDRLAR